MHFGLRCDRIVSQLAAWAALDPRLRSYNASSLGGGDYGGAYCGRGRAAPALSGPAMNLLEEVRFPGAEASLP